MQILFGYMVQDFADRASRPKLDLPALDSLTAHVLAAAPEVPLYAAKTALARLTRLQEEFVASLSGTGAICLQDSRTWIILDQSIECSVATSAVLSADTPVKWPSRRQLFLLQLWYLVFPASDRRHPVMTPAALLVAAYLALCPVQSHEDADKGKPFGFLMQMWEVLLL